MLNIGLKIGSVDVQYTDEIKKLYEKGVFQYIELFSVLNTFNDTISYWKQFDIPFGIHAPHSMAGLNLANYNEHKANLKKIEESIKFADSLKADYIIFHSGVNGNIEESVSQLRSFCDRRFLLENKPVKGFGNVTCVGSSFKELKTAIDELNCGFVLDFGHAVCAARTLQKDPIIFIQELNKLSPKIFHLTDGDFYSEYDSHFHYGDGNFPLKDFLNFVPSDAFVTNEAKRFDLLTLSEVEKDSCYLRNLR